MNFRPTPLLRRGLVSALLLASVPAVRAGAPSLTVAGAYFPAWLLCALAGVAGALVARSVMITTGLAQSLPLQLPVCAAIGTLCGMVLWFFWAGA